MVNVQPTRRHIRSHQDFQFGFPEFFHDPVPLYLAQVTMQSFRHITARHQGCGQLIGAFLGAAENDGTLHVAGIQDAAQSVELFTGLVVVLVDLGNRQLFLADRNEDGFVHVAVGQGTDLLRHRRREQQCLTAFPRNVFHNGFDIVDEAHVEHFIRFVQNQRLHQVQFDGAAPDMIQQAARRTNDDLDAKT